MTSRLTKTRSRRLFFYCVGVLEETNGPEMICKQMQLGELVKLTCPPVNAHTLDYCCNENGRISCCSYEDYMHRVDGQSTEAVIWLAATFCAFIAIAGVLCYIKWQGKKVKFAEENVEMHSSDLPEQLNPDIHASQPGSVQHTVQSIQSCYSNKTPGIYIDQPTIQSMQSYYSNKTASNYIDQPTIQSVCSHCSSKIPSILVFPPEDPQQTIHSIYSTIHSYNSRTSSSRYADALQEIYRTQEIIPPQKKISRSYDTYI